MTVNWIPALEFRSASPDTECPIDGCHLPVTVIGLDRFGVLRYQGGCCHITGIAPEASSWRIGFAKDE